MTKRKRQSIQMKQRLGIKNRRGPVFTDRAVIFRDASKYDRNLAKESFRKELASY